MLVLHLHWPAGRHLNRFIDYPLLKVRLLHWFNFRHNLTGFLHWGGNFGGLSRSSTFRR